MSSGMQFSQIIIIIHVYKSRNKYVQLALVGEQVADAYEARLVADRVQAERAAVRIEVDRRDAHLRRLVEVGRPTFRTAWRFHGVQWLQKHGSV